MLAGVDIKFHIINYSAKNIRETAQGCRRVKSHVNTSGKNLLQTSERDQSSTSEDSDF